MIFSRKRCVGIIFLFSFLIPSQFAFSSELIKGDKNAPEGQTFSFPVGKYASSFRDYVFYVAAHPDAVGDSRDFAIAKLLTGRSVFVPIAPEEVTLDGLELQENPLFNEGIEHLALLETGECWSTVKYPIVVPSDHRDEIYAIDDSRAYEAVLVASAKDIKDANGEKALQIDEIAAGVNSLVFAAVRNNRGDPFGEFGSGIAILELDDDTLELSQIGVAVPLDRASSVVQIADNVQAMQLSDMHWDPCLGRLYASLSVESGPVVFAGAKALVVGRIQNNNLVLTSIAPDSVFVDQNEIVGAVGPNSEVSLHAVRTMLSRKGLNYVIVLGGNGNPALTERSVFALPLVSDPSDDNNHGRLASKDALPEEWFDGTCRYRYLKGAASTPADIFTSADAAARVGGGDLPNDIDDIFVSRDAVYAVQSFPYNESGIFVSYALFDDNGKINGWTAWESIVSPANASEGIFGAALDSVYESFLFMSGHFADNVTTVRRTPSANGDENGEDEGEDGGDDTEETEEKKGGGGSNCFLNTAAN